MKVYLSGPITGDPDHESNFAYHADKLESGGHEVVNPVELDDEQDPEMEWADYLRRDIAALMECDAIAMIPGWESSRGAVLERHVAEAVGLRVIELTEEGATAPAGPQTWEEALDWVLAEMRAIMVERQRKYGKSNIRDQGLYGVITRGSADKVARINGALNGTLRAGRVILDPIDDGSDSADTFQDGLLDAANYFGPIATMVYRDWWELPYGPELDGARG